MALELPTGTVTFLFTDIEGSTRLLADLGESYSEVLAEHHRVIREAIERHGGIEVDTQGDAFFVAFTRASDAVAAADTAQAALAVGPVRVRMGLHTGEPRITDEGYLGIDVHRAARIGNAANGGQVVISPTTRELLGDEVELRDLGEHRLKDFPTATRLFQLGTAEFPPLRTPDEARLPLASSPLIGRKKELADALRLLRDGGVRLLTITGPGGVGKTRFAIEAASESLGSFTDGARFADLAPLRSADAVVPAIAQSIRAPGSVVEALRRQEVLLVLDNAEHVAAAAPELGSLLDSCPGVSMLVTSREPLHLSLERELPLRPMPEAPAVELFRQRGQMADPEFEGEYPVLADICGRLDGLPLAIELAAARVKLLGTEGLRERLEHRLPLLTGRGRDAPERQRTLRATIEWSYDLLDEEEQRVFNALAVFVGGFTLEAAEEVAEADLDTLDSLVDKSLIRQEEGRLSMLETIREFAFEHLQDSTRQKHAEHFLDLAVRAFDVRRVDIDTGGPEFSKVFGPEYENVRVAMGWFRQIGDAESHLRTALGCHAHWFDNGPWAEALRILGDALDRYREPDELRAWGILSAGTFAWRLGDFELGLRYTDEGLEAARRLGDDRLTMHFLVGKGICASKLGDRELSSAAYKEAEAHARASGDDYALATVLVNLANVALDVGDYATARPYAEEAMEVVRRGGYRAALANSLIDAGFIALAEERTDQAAAYFAECGSICADLPLSETRSWLLEGVAAMNAALGRFADAAVLLGAAAALRKSLGIGAYYPIGDEFRQRVDAEARERLGDVAFEAAWAEGRSLSVDRAVQLARSTLDSTDG